MVRLTRKGLLINMLEVLTLPLWSDAILAHAGLISSPIWAHRERFIAKIIKWQERREMGLHLFLICFELTIRS